MRGILPLSEFQMTDRFCGGQFCAENHNHGQMGSWLSDRIGANLDIGGSIQNALGQLSSNLHNINWGDVGRNLGKVSNVIGNVLTQLNPIYITYQLYSTNPVTEHAFHELDRFTGGLLTSTKNLSTLPARTIRGDAITKAELIDDALLALKLAIVIYSGGTASSIISASSGQLSKGYLGETGVGRSFLVVGSVAAGGIMAPEGEASNVIAESVVRQGSGLAQVEVVKHTELGRTGLGQIAIGAGFALGTATGVETVTDKTFTVTDTLTSYGESQAISQAGRFVPGGSPLASMLITQGKKQTWDFSSSGDGGGDSGGSGFNFNFDIGQGLGNIANWVSNIDLGGGGGLPSISVDGISAPDISAPNISMPGISAPSIPEINIGQIPDITMPNGQKKKPISRTKKVVKGKTYYTYNFGDGTSTDIESVDTENYALYALMVGIGLMLI